MNINKLEALACLRFDKTKTKELSTSIDEVVTSLQEIIKVEINEQNDNPVNNTVFRNEKYVPSEKQGLNITDDGYFLAPKVIKKD